MNRPIGTAISMAISEVTTVPYIGAMAPNCSVTGFQTSSYRKLTPNLCSAGHDPQTSEKMIPPRMTRTVTAAARVRWRNATSPRRRRCRTLARSTSSAAEMPEPCNATSTTGRLPVGCIRLSLGFSPLGRATQATSGPQHKPSLAGGGQGKGAIVAPFPLTLRSVGHREHGLAVRVLDLVAPVFLDVLDDICRHRDVVEALRPSCRPSCRPRRRTSAPRRVAAASTGFL